MIEEPDVQSDWREHRGGRKEAEVCSSWNKKDLVNQGPGLGWGYRSRKTMKLRGFFLTR